MAELRWPGQVPDDEPPLDAPVDVSAGVDTDGDGRPDTVVTDDGVDLIVHTDLDGDGIADQVLRIGPTGIVREVAPHPVEIHAAFDGLLGGAEAGAG